MKGYKAFDKNLKCRGMQYEIGKTYKYNGEISLCTKGYHFCKDIADCFKYYNSTDTRFAEIEATGEIIESENDGKCVTEKITILSEIPHDVAVRMSNTGDCNTGDCNTGDCNTGNRNTGNRNTGNRNTGNRNTGNCNTGDWNTGNRNTGNWNTGNWNTGDWNTGDCNTGNRNTGNWNTGDWNTGDCNTGDWNTTNFETGCFCTKESEIRFFNKASNFSRTDWLNSHARRILNEMPDLIVEFVYESNMNDAEKEQNPSYKTTGGYLKVTDKKEARQEWWDGLSEDDKKEIMSLPNFDTEIFKECTGINEGE